MLRSDAIRNPTIIMLSLITDGSATWEGPDDFSEALQSTDQEENLVVFGPRNSWYVQWNDGSWLCSGLPTRLYNMLNSNNHRWVRSLSISSIESRESTDDASWFLHWHDSSAPRWRGWLFPDMWEEINDIVDDEKGQVFAVEFGGDGEWVLIVQKH